MADRPREAWYFCLLMSSVICKIMHKIGFLGQPMGDQGQYMCFNQKLLTQRNLEAEFYWENVFYL